MMSDNPLNNLLMLGAIFLDGPGVGGEFDADKPD
jgi:hypothetical protein